MIEGPEIISSLCVFNRRTKVLKFLCLLFCFLLVSLVDTDKKRLFRERCMRNSAKALALPGAPVAKHETFERHSLLEKHSSSGSWQRC